MTHLGKLIDRRLNELGWERKRLADELQIVPVSVSRWLRPEGDNPVSWHFYVLLSAVLKIPLDDILKAAEKDTPHYVAMYQHYFGREAWHGAESPRRRRVQAD